MVTMARNVIFHVDIQAMEESAKRCAYVILMIAIISKDARILQVHVIDFKKFKANLLR